VYYTGVYYTGVIRGVYCAVASSTHEEPCTSSQVVTVNDEAIAMAALSSMADCVSSEQFAPSSSEQIVPSQQRVSCELAPDQISSEHFTANSELVRSEHLIDSVQMAIDLSSANVVASESLT